MSVLPIPLRPDLSERLAAALDREAKIVRGLDALGPVAGRDVVLVDAGTGAIRAGLEGLGARLTDAPLGPPFGLNLPDASADVVVGLWSAFRGVDPGELVEVDRVLRPEGRLLAVHDYGRDDVSRLFDDRPEYGTWGRRSGPFLSAGFRVRVLHCWWEFDDQDQATEFLGDAFGERGAALAATLKRPRVSYKVAIYHRVRPSG